MSEDIGIKTKQSSDIHLSDHLSQIIKIEREQELSYQTQKTRFIDRTKIPHFQEIIAEKLKTIGKNYIKVHRTLIDAMDLIFPEQEQKMRKKRVINWHNQETKNMVNTLDVLNTIAGHTWRD